MPGNVVFLFFRFFGRFGNHLVRILAKARELDLPVDPKRVSVERRGARIVLKASYTVPVEFPFYTYNWKFDVVVDRPVFLVEFRPRPGPELA